MTEEEALHLKSKYKLKKLLEQIEAIKGRHTELVTVYVPAGTAINEMMSQLRLQNQLYLA